MTRAFVLILLVAACFVAAVLFLVSGSRVRDTSMRYAAAAAAVIGSVLYGYGYAACFGLSLTSLFRALFALCRMFGGVNDLASIEAAPLMKNPVVLTVFWFGHFLAFYVTASAAIGKLGEQLLVRIRVKHLRRGPLLVIYGVAEQTLLFGRSMIRAGWSVLFVDADCMVNMAGEIMAMGAVLENTAEALAPTTAFLRHIGIRPGSRRVELAVLRQDAGENLDYARSFLAAAKAAGIRREQVSLLSRGIGEEAAALQNEGFGSVYDFDPYDLTARIAVRENPPCDMISFDEKGLAREDFQAVILGFGRMGRAMLSQLIMNGQFDGSRFRVDVFDPGAESCWMHSEELSAAYDIRFHAADGKSNAFFNFLRERGDAVRCICLCTGSSRENAETAEDIRMWLWEHARRPVIIQVTRDCLMGRDGRIRNIWNGDIPDIQRMDAMAMEINGRYHAAEGRSAWEEWQRCDYFSRMSCRASADFMPARLRAAGKTVRQVLDGDWPPDPETLEHLSVTEHMRWCAFHRVMGYRTMSPDVFLARAALWKKAREDTEQPAVRIAKDTEHRLHACLVPWDELDALSARESAVTGEAKDYKAYDRDNVLVLRDVLRRMYGGGKEADDGRQPV